MKLPHVLLIILLALTAAAVEGPAAASAAGSGRTYFVSATGDDRGDGLSQATAWRSISRVNQAHLEPGDTVGFQGGQTFAGKIYLTPDEEGSASSPIRITSYGEGRATISSPGDTGLYAYNTAGIVVSNLIFVGGGRTTAPGGDGIYFFNDLPGDIKKTFVRIDNVEVSDFYLNGIVFGAGNGRSGFRDVRVTNSSVHDNGRNGVFAWGGPRYSHTDFEVRSVSSVRNTGTPGISFSTGSGILLSSVDGALIDHSVARENGALSTSEAGPVGIWAFDANNVVIQFCESTSNHSGVDVDGLGFDLDENVSNSTMHHNFSSGNDGSGFVLIGQTKTSDSTNNSVYSNLSVDDGRKNAPVSTAGLFLFGGGNRLSFFQNTVVMSSNARSTARAILVGNWNDPEQKLTDVVFRENVLITSEQVPMIEVIGTAVQGAARFRFEDNAYFSRGTGASFLWNERTFDSLGDWRQSSGQEVRAGISTGTSGLVAPGQLPASSQLGTVTGISGLLAAQLAVRPT